VGVEQLTAASIPTGWGKLISVTSLVDYPRSFQLWFQDDAGKVRLVRYDYPTHEVGPEVVTIPRQ